ncbi:hypothetical protein CALVIDRAFT_67771 [Calocera viscosa TUFC12733]|uniref:Uncharacterized protein n=1 Tax=Calocera viscosa (strain TUFC12733) TaxID=1330018 RepID=A0A167N8G2_CALVF|nr:hypothetical protein CALVIDRAFT_67771 [Calocera viscosa TUFC12733]
MKFWPGGRECRSGLSDGGGRQEHSKHWQGKRVSSPSSCKSRVLGGTPSPPPQRLYGNNAVYSSHALEIYRPASPLAVLGLRPAHGHRAQYRPQVAAGAGGARRAALHASMSAGAHQVEPCPQRYVSLNAAYRDLAAYPSASPKEIKGSRQGVQEWWAEWVAVGREEWEKRYEEMRELHEL